MAAELECSNRDVTMGIPMEEKTLHPPWTLHSEQIGIRCFIIGIYYFSSNFLNGQFI